MSGEKRPGGSIAISHDAVRQNEGHEKVAEKAKQVCRMASEQLSNKQQALQVAPTALAVAVEAERAQHQERDACQKRKRQTEGNSAGAGAAAGAGGPAPVTTAAAAAAARSKKEIDDENALPRWGPNHNQARQLRGSVSVKLKRGEKVELNEESYQYRTDLICPIEGCNSYFHSFWFGHSHPSVHYHKRPELWLHVVELHNAIKAKFPNDAKQRAAASRLYREMLGATKKGIQGHLKAAHGLSDAASLQLQEHGKLLCEITSVVKARQVKSKHAVAGSGLAAGDEEEAAGDEQGEPGDAAQPRRKKQKTRTEEEAGDSAQPTVNWQEEVKKERNALNKKQQRGRDRQDELSIALHELDETQASKARVCDEWLRQLVRQLERMAQTNVEDLPAPCVQQRLLQAVPDSVQHTGKGALVLALQWEFRQKLIQRHAAAAFALLPDRSRLLLGAGIHAGLQAAYTPGVAQTDIGSEHWLGWRAMMRDTVLHMPKLLNTLPAKDMLVLPNAERLALHALETAKESLSEPDTVQQAFAMATRPQVVPPGLRIGAAPSAVMGQPPNTCHRGQPFPPALYQHQQLQERPASGQRYSMPGMPPPAAHHTAAVTPSDDAVASRGVAALAALSSSRATSKSRHQCSAQHSAHATQSLRPNAGSSTYSRDEALSPHNGQQQAQEAAKQRLQHNVTGQLVGHADGQDDSMHNPSLDDTCADLNRPADVNTTTPPLSGAPPDATARNLLDTHICPAAATTTSARAAGAAGDALSLQANGTEQPKAGQQVVINAQRPATTPDNLDNDMVDQEPSASRSGISFKNGGRRHVSAPRPGVGLLGPQPAKPLRHAKPSTPPKDPNLPKHRDSPILGKTTLVHFPCPFHHSMPPAHSCQYTWRKPSSEYIPLNEDHFPLAQSIIAASGTPAVWKLLQDSCDQAKLTYTGKDTQDPHRKFRLLICSLRAHMRAAHPEESLTQVGMRVAELPLVGGKRGHWQACNPVDGAQDKRAADRARKRWCQARQKPAGTTLQTFRREAGPQLPGMQHQSLLATMQQSKRGRDDSPAAAPAPAAELAPAAAGAAEKRKALGDEPAAAAEVEAADAAAKGKVWDDQPAAEAPTEAAAAGGQSSMLGRVTTTTTGSSQGDIDEDVGPEEHISEVEQELEHEALAVVAQQDEAGTVTLRSVVAYAAMKAGLWCVGLGAAWLAYVYATPEDW